jgi:hypothetical protein
MPILGAQASQNIKSFLHIEKFVAATSSYSQNTLASANGINWNSYTNSLPGNVDYRLMAYGNGVYVTFGPFSSTSATSTDAVTWTTRTLPNANNWTALEFGNGRFVATSYSGGGVATVSATSVDGINWTTGDMPDDVAFGPTEYRALAYGNGYFKAFGYYSNVVATSTNGTTWTAAYSEAAATWKYAQYGGGVWVVIAVYGDVQFATDGVYYSYTGLPEDSYFVTGLTYGAGKFVIVSRYTLSQTTGYNYVATSPDGNTWTAQTAPALPYRNVNYGAGLFVAIANDDQSGSTDYATSPDGVTWTQRTLPTSGLWNAVTFG